MHAATYRWIKIAVINLLIVSMLGVLMRYKIAYSFPFLHQKFILHAHSHFAFAGWITQALMALMVAYLQRHRADAFDRYKPILVANLVTAYGMLLSFPVQGYGVVSISFSTLNIITAYWFGIRFWRDLDKMLIKANSHSWFKAAIVFNVISSFGAFTLAYMMATKNLHPNQYLAAVYFFLHFQYNGWFFFACMGLLSDQLLRTGMRMEFTKPVFVLFAAACIPAYFLSALWLPIPMVIYILVVLSAVAQVIAGFIFFIHLRRQRHLFLAWSNTTGYWFITLAGMALGIKLLLQLGSTIPELSDLAFGFRPIVIGYLHLVLLAVISLFIIGYIVANKFIRLDRSTKTGLNIFTGGIVLNEMLLMIQGISAMSYEGIPFMDLYLLGAGIVMFAGLLMLVVSLKRSTAME